MEKCVLCRQQGDKDNPLNRHHYRGRKNFPHDVIWVHSKTCHMFAEWITNLYILAGKEAELGVNQIIYLYTRVITLQHGSEFSLPL